MNVRAVVLAASFALLPTWAMAQDAMQGVPMGHGPADEGYMKAMKGMHQGMMGMKPTGDSDKDFVMMMIPHHQGAVDMAKVELEYGKDPILRKMAEEIIKSQSKEIAEMKAWQKKNGM